jgi:hypothetical protein
MVGADFGQTLALDGRRVTHWPLQGGVSPAQPVASHDKGTSYTRTLRCRFGLGTSQHLVATGRNTEGSSWVIATTPGGRTPPLPIVGLVDRTPNCASSFFREILAEITQPEWGRVGTKAPPHLQYGTGN